MKLTQQKVDDLCKRIYLDQYGFRLDRKTPSSAAPRLAEVKRCMEYIKANKHTMRKNSYGLKHQVELWIEQTTGHSCYIPQGAVVVAALLLGIRVEPMSNADGNSVIFLDLFRE